MARWFWDRLYSYDVDNTLAAVFYTDDQVPPQTLLERGFKITAISHEGVALPKVDFDRIIKTTAGVLATRHLCRSLGIDAAEAHHRFGSPT